jgi:hypothetical protein
MRQCTVYVGAYYEAVVASVIDLFFFFFKSEFISRARTTRLCIVFRHVTFWREPAASGYGQRAIIGGTACKSEFSVWENSKKTLRYCLTFVFEFLCPKNLKEIIKVFLKKKNKTLTKMLEFSRPKNIF